MGLFLLFIGFDTNLGKIYTKSTVEVTFTL